MSILSHAPISARVLVLNGPAPWRGAAAEAAEAWEQEAAAWEYCTYRRMRRSVATWRTAAARLAHARAGTTQQRPPRCPTHSKPSFLDFTSVSGCVSNRRRSTHHITTYQASQMTYSTVRAGAGGGGGGILRRQPRPPRARRLVPAVAPGGRHRAGQHVAAESPGALHAAGVARQVGWCNSIPVKKAPGYSA